MHWMACCLCAKCMKDRGERKNPYAKTDTGQGGGNMVYMYTIIREHQSTDLPIAGQRPQKGDRHAGNIRQDQSAGRE